MTDREKEEGAAAFLAHLKALEGQGINIVNEHTATRHDLVLGDVVTACGGVFIEEDVNDSGQFNFEISLGPVNAKRLVDFLLTLPNEKGWK